MDQPTVLCRYCPFCRPTHLKIDWINTEHHKNLYTIGKQNYQEPGVEAVLVTRGITGDTGTLKHSWEYFICFNHVTS